jgi:hypothetical protein
MFRILLFTTALLVSFSGRAQVAVDWVQRQGAYTTDRGIAVKVDSHSNVFAGGIFTDTLYLDGQYHYGLGFLDSYVSKLDSTGAYQWLTLVQGPKDDQLTRLALLGNGDVMATGTFADSVSIDNQTIYAQGNDDAWLARLNGNDGSVQWLISVGSVYAYETVGGLCCDANAIYWAVNYGATCIIGTQSLTAQGLNDAAIITVDLDGNIISTKSFSGSANDNITTLATDHQGNVFAGGKYNGDFYGRQNNGGFDMFVIKINGADTLWMKTFGGAGSETATAMTFNNDQLFVAAWSNDTLQVNDTLVASDQGGEMLMLSCDPNGNQQWLFHGFEGEGADYINDVTAACNGDILFTGYTTYFANHEPLSPSLSVKQAGCAFGDTYVARMNTVGELLWIKNTLGTNLNSGNAVATDSSGHIYITGYFTDSLYLYNTAIKGNGGNDGFLFRFTHSVACVVADDTLDAALTLSQSNGFMLYPNPSNGKAYIVSTKSFANAQLIVCDITGRTVHQAVVNTNDSVVALQQLIGSIAPGYYTVTFSSKNCRASLAWIVTQ